MKTINLVFSAVLAVFIFIHWLAFIGWRDARAEQRREAE